MTTLAHAPVARTAPRFQEFDPVVLTRDATLEGARLLAGARGTVLLVYDGGEAYEVEFMTPTHAVVGVPAELLSPLA